MAIESEQTDAGIDRAPAEYAETRTIALPEEPHEVLPESFAALQPSPQWWAARPAGSRLVGLVVARDDMPSIVRQRDALAQFGVAIDDFRHPAPDIGESWSERLTRLFGHLVAGDVLVVADVRALGRDRHEETLTVAELRRRAVIVKVLGDSRS